MTIVLIAALVSVVLGFGFAPVESAVSRMTRLRVASLAEDGHAAAPALGAVVERHSTALMVLTFMRVGAEMTAAVLVTVAATRIFDDFWPALITAVAVMAVVSFVLVRSFEDGGEDGLRSPTCILQQVDTACVVHLEVRSRGPQLAAVAYHRQ